jgi:hypothetical protein
MNQPPCWAEGQPCPNDCASQRHDRIVHNVTPLHGRWAGWRMAGRELVSPDGDRISSERLRGIMFREAGLARIAACRNRRKAMASVATLPPRERFDGSA